jgi:RNA polymerase sigma-70 factor (ECF subfamily)
MDDFELLRDFAGGSEEAFAILVERHVDAVYSVALRTVHSPQLAEEIVFSVFNDLARNASKLKPTSPLIAWLFSVTRRTGLDALKRERRRALRERVAFEQREAESSAAVPEEILAVLDSSLERLKTGDRTVILLRYFQEQSVAEIARCLGVGTDTAQKRIERALERLRKQLVRRGVHVTVGGLATALLTNATQSAPVGMAPALSAGAKFVAAATFASRFGNLAIMTTTQKAAVLFVAAGLLTTGIYQQIKLSQADGHLDRAAKELANIRNDLAAEEAKLASANAEIQQLREQAREIHRLRGELSARQKESEAAPNSHPAASATGDYLSAIDALKNAFAAAPEKRIPEMTLLTEREWLEAAIVMRESPADGLDKAMAHLRTLAKGKYSLHINRALQKFVAANAGALPASPAELGEYLGDGIDRSALVRYEMIRTGTTNEIAGAETILRERTRISEFDSQFNIGLMGAGFASPKRGGSERTYGFSFTSDDLPED